MLEELTPPVTAGVPTGTASLRISPFVLLLLSALVYLGTTGMLPLLGRDEPRYVQIGREMLESGDWITPHLGGFTWFEKPVLLYWMTAASFAVFGVSEWAARLGPALCGMGSAAVLWWMVRRTGETRAEWSCITLLSSGGMIAFAHGATFDIVLTACITLSLGAWWRAQEAENPTRLLALFWAGIGLSCLAKGLVGFVIPLGTVVMYAALARRRVRVGFGWGLPLALAVVLVWYGPVIWINGWKFVQEFFIQHHFQRFTSDKYKHHQPVWYYLEILPLLALPWSPFLLWALWRQWSQRHHPGPDQNLNTFALAWTLVPVLFFSLSGSKLPGYILPALPGACVLIASGVESWTRDSNRTQIARALAGGMLILTALVSTTSPGVRHADMSSARLLFDVAHARGLGHLRVINFRTVSRPSEFYAAGQLIYGQDGEPLCLKTPSQVREMSATEPLLVLARERDCERLAQANVTTEKLASCGSESLVLVWRRDAAKIAGYSASWPHSG